MLPRRTAPAAWALGYSGQNPLRRRRCTPAQPQEFEMPAFEAYASTSLYPDPMSARSDDTTVTKTAPTELIIAVLDMQKGRPSLAGRPAKTTNTRCSNSLQTGFQTDHR